MIQRVLVTAGASGIGLEIVRAFAANGSRVSVCDVDAVALESLRREIPGIVTKVCDLAVREEIETMVGYCAEATGGLDVLVNNAGVSGPTAPIEAMDPEEWDKVMQVNLTGTFDVSRFAIAHLKKSGSGAIINISSVAGRFGYANRSPYCTSKWGTIGFTKTLAIELGGYGIRVNAILPGAVEGPRLQRVFEERARLWNRPVEEVREASLENQSIKAFVDAKDIAAVALFLASDCAKSISGQMIPVDGDMQKAS